MDQLQYQLELAGFEEKISLAELEESKAAERVMELKYERARFQMQWMEMIAKAQQQAKMAQPAVQPQK